MSQDPSAQTNASIEGHVGRIAAHVLAQHGVSHLFTLSGGHLFSLYDGCVKAEDLTLVDVRHEQSAVFAAEAWAKVTRKIGVAALTAGPGVTNGVSALTTAHFLGSPITVLGGRAPEARWGQGSLQELDHVPLVAPVCRSAETCRTVESVVPTLDAALRTAQTPHRGPTFVDLPMDVAFAPTAVAPLAAPGPDELRAPEADPDEVRGVGQLLARAERPVLMVGADAYWAGCEGELRLLCEETSTPAIANGLARGLLPADHELALSRARSAAFKGADLVIVVGTPLDFRVGFGRFGDAKVVHLMETPERLASHVELAGAVAGDLPSTLAGVREAALAEGPSDLGAWVTELRGIEAERRAAERELLEATSDPIRPPSLYGELTRRISRDTIVIGDGGDFVSYAGKYVDTFTPGCFLDPGPYGCLGTGLGAAIGASLARPDRPVVLLLGDGAAGFSLAELDTLARFELPVTILVGNNGCWGLEKHPMQQIFGYHVAAELSPDTRYDKVAEGLGCRGERIETHAELGPALDRALASGGPTLLDIVTDPEDVYPRSSNLA